MSKHTHPAALSRLAGHLKRVPSVWRQKRHGAPHDLASTCDLKIGDLIFIRIGSRPFLEVAHATQSWTNHVGIVVAFDQGQALIAESKVPLVRTTSMASFVARSQGSQYAVARLLKPLDDAQCDAVASAAQRRMGIFYDTGFNLDSKRQFCSRFVREVLYEATGVAVGEVQNFSTLLERNPSANLGFWRYWYLGRIPWQRNTVTPASVFTSPHLQVLFQSPTTAGSGATGRRSRTAATEHVALSRCA